MPPRSPEPLRKVTLNLFDKDCDSMERRYGHGWSERVRDLVRQDLKRAAQQEWKQQWGFTDEQ